MLASQLFWRIFAVYAALAVISVSVFAGILSVRHKAVLDQQIRDRLRDDALIIRDLWDSGDADAGELSVDDLPRLPPLSRPVRVAFITVETAAHSTEKDVQQAVRLGEGFANRRTTADHPTELCYTLRLGSDAAPRGYLQVASPRRSSDAVAPLFDLQFWGAAAAMIAVGLWLTHRVVSRIIGPLETLTQAARQIAAGQAPKETRIQSRNEIGTLAEAFNSMSRQLASRIDDLQAQRRKLQHNNEQLETVLSAMVEGVIAVDAQERVMLANSAALQLLEMAPAAMIGRPIWEAVRQPRIDELVRQALRGETPERLEFAVSRAQHIISVAASQLPGEPCPGAVLVLHDVTELRKLEHLRREFVANVSHELKTPLTSIAAYTETLLDGAIDDPDHNKAFLKRIEEQTERLQGLIVGLLSLARMEADETRLEIAPTKVTEAVTACVDAHETVAEAKGIRLSVELPLTETEVLADAEGVRTIMDNLLDNAINYTPTGGRVAVRCFTEGEWLQIDVSDTGVGIAREFQARIFERFFRVDKARSRELGGTGLGLSIVKHLCQVFGGTVGVTSQLGQGSTFTVRLKRVLSDALA